MASDSGTIAIHLAGEVRVVGTDAVVHPRDVGGPRCDGIVAFLAVNRHREVPLEELAQVVWPERRPPSWYSGLRGLLVKVRSAIALAGMPALTVRAHAGTVRLSLPAGTVTDLELARRWTRTDGDDVSTAITDARAALDILDHPVLPTVVGEWADAIRAEVAQMTDAALTIDAVGSSRLDHHQDAVTVAERLLALDPLRESTYRILMQAFIGLGERARALTVAARCREILSEQLGVLPSAETEALFLRILRDAPPTEPRPPHVPTRRREAVVARDTELQIIADCLARSATGRGQFLVVTGEAGAGKTTIVTEAMARARRGGIRVVSGRCSEEAVISFEPLADAVRREHQRLGRSVNGAGVGDADVSILDLLTADRSTELLAARGLPEDDHRAEVMDAVLEWVTPSRDEGTTMLVLDDLHWASAATLDVIRHLVTATSSRNVCVIATVREEFADRPQIRTLFSTGTARAESHRIRLRGFDVDAVAELVAASGADLDPVALHARTGGLPLFVSSLISTREIDSQHPRDGVTHTRSPEAELQLPESIAASVAQREHTLGDTARTMVRLCAVIGMTAPRPVLRAAMPECDDFEFASALDELIGHRLVTESDLGDEVMLRHPLVQEAIYARIDAPLRQAMHSEVARALEQWGTAGHTDAARLAHHLARGRETDRAQAVDRFWQAGDSAMSIGAHEDAVDLYLSAAERLTPEDDSARRCRLMVATGRARRKAGDPAFRPTLLEAAAMAKRLGDLDLQVAATLANDQQGVLNVQIVVDAERIASLGDAIDALDAAGRPDGADIAHLAAQLAVESIWTFDHHVRHDLVVRGIAAARAANDRDSLVDILSSTLTGIHHRDLDDLRRRAYRELVDLMDGSAARTVEPLRAVKLMRAHVQYGALDRATSTLRRISPAQLARDPETAWLVTSTEYGIDCTSGRLARCERALADLRAIPASPTGGYTYGRLLPSLFSLRILRGDMGEIVGAADGLVDRFHMVGFYRMCLATAYADCGDLTAAAELVAWHTPKRIDSIPDDPIWMCSMAVLGRVAAQIGDTAVCAHVYERLAPYGDQSVASGSFVLGSVHHHLAEMSIALGESTRAAAHLDDAFAVHSARGYRGWYAETAYLAVALEVRRDRSPHPSTVARARRSADESGATAVRRRLDSLMAVPEVIGTCR